MMNIIKTIRLKRLIRQFIESTSDELLKSYNIILTKKSISGMLRKKHNGTYLIGNWRFATKENVLEAACNKRTGENSESEIVVEIKERNNRFSISDWSVKEFF